MIRQVRARLALMLVCVCVSVSRAAAQSSSARGAQLLVEVEPVYAFGNGIGGNVLVTAGPRWRLGVRGATGDIRDPIKGLFYENADEIGDVRLQWLAAAEVRYGLRGDEGPYVGLSLGREQWRVRSRSGDEARRTQNFWALPAAGWVWSPGQQTRFYVHPQGGVLWLFDRDPEGSVGGVSYRVRPIVPTFTVAFGLRL